MTFVTQETTGSYGNIIILDNVNEDGKIMVYFETSV